MLQDPHLYFAYGGRADFRGRNGAFYSFLSAPGLAVNVKIEEALFTLHDGALTVNGSFITEAHVLARGIEDRQVSASFFSKELDELNSGWQVVTGSCAGRPFKFGFHGHKDCLGVKMAMDFSSATFKVGNWTITVHGMPSCRGCLISGPHHRLDVSFAAHGGAPANGPPHGLIGQSFATPGVARNGAVDVYPWEGEFTTRAQAEGAIEGAADMYEVASPYETRFAFSVFDAAKRDESLASAHDATSEVDASSIERSPTAA